MRCPDSEERAQELGHQFFWQKGALGKQPREWIAPPGYASVDVEGIRKLRAVSKPFDSQAYQEAQDNYQVVVGTPDQVIDIDSAVVRLTEQMSPHFKVLAIADPRLGVLPGFGED